MITLLYHMILYQMSHETSFKLHKVINLVTLNEMWSLWWTKWYWVLIFYEYFGFLPSLSFHHCFIPSFIYHKCFVIVTMTTALNNTSSCPLWNCWWKLRKHTECCWLITIIFIYSVCSYRPHSFLWITTLIPYRTTYHFVKKCSFPGEIKHVATMWWNSTLLQSTSSRLHALLSLILLNWLWGTQGWCPCSPYPIPLELSFCGYLKKLVFQEKLQTSGCESQMLLLQLSYETILNA